MVGLVVVGLSPVGRWGLVVLEFVNSVSSRESFRACPEFWVRGFTHFRGACEDFSFAFDKAFRKT